MRGYNGLLRSVQPEEPRSTELLVEYARNHNTWVCSSAFEVVAAKLRGVSLSEAEGVMDRVQADPEATQREKSAAVMLRSLIKAVLPEKEVTP